MRAAGDVLLRLLCSGSMLLCSRGPSPQAEAEIPQHSLASNVVLMWFLDACLLPPCRRRRLTLRLRWRRRPAARPKQLVPCSPSLRQPSGTRRNMHAHTFWGTARVSCGGTFPSKSKCHSLTQHRTHFLGWQLRGPPPCRPTLPGARRPATFLCALRWAAPSPSSVHII